MAKIMEIIEKETKGKSYQPMGLKMNPENRWVKKAETIPWEAIEEKYAALFPSKKGMPAKRNRNTMIT